MPFDPGQLDRGGRLVGNCAADGAPSAHELESGGARWLNASCDDLLGLGADPRVREAFLAAHRKLGFQALPDAALATQLRQTISGVLKQPVALVATDARAVLRCLPTWRCAIDARSRPLADDATSVATVEEAEVLLATNAISGVLVEALHRHEGDLAPLPRFAEVCERFRATLVVSDPCGLGVLGPTGAGAVEQLQVAEQVGLHLLGLGAAIPGGGVIVTGQRDLVSALEGQLEAPPTAQLAAAARALELSAAEPHRRARLFEVSQQLLHALRGFGFDTGPCVTPWIPVWLGEQTLCQQWLDALAEASIAARGWIAPGASRLLLSLAATTSDAQLHQLLDTFARLARKLTVPEPPSHVAGPLPVMARPGTYTLSAPCGPNWLATTSPAHPRVDEGPMAAAPPLRSRLFDAVETLTWRASNTSGRSVRATADAFRALFDRRRRG